MIRYACNPPGVNAESIVNQGLPKLGLAPQTPTVPLTGFGITVDAEMTVIPARELAPPGLTYKSGRPDVRNGSWNILDVKFQRGAVVSSWWVLVVRDGNLAISGPQDPALKGLVQGFAAKCRRSGMTVPEGFPRLLVTPQLPPPGGDPGRVGALALIRKVLVDALRDVNNKKPSFILVLLSLRDNYIYPGIKRFGDVELGLHTVHMQLSKALKDEKKQDQYFSNVALKVNTKLGGINHVLDANAMQWLTAKKTMVVGMDVTHPSPNSKEGTPSIAAVVASVESSFVQFPASMRVQEGREEVCQFQSVPGLTVSECSASTDDTRTTRYDGGTTIAV
jgi:eukaryotic translation initiation factor 2C